MEHLTKSQIVLLTLFVSFVASMATGIVVVTLMEQTPAPVGQTITNVVERTIEKITPTPIEKTTKQVVVNNEDLRISAVENNIKSVVAFKVASESGDFIPSGVGTIVSPDGLVVTNRGNFGYGVLTTTIGGVQYVLQVLSDKKENSLGIGRLTPVSASSTRAFSVAALGSADSLRLGQSAIIIGGRDGKTITNDIVNDLNTHTITDKSTKTDTIVVDSIGVSGRYVGSSNGSPIITLNGDIVGFLSVDDVTGVQKGVPAAEAKRLIDEVNTPVPVNKI